MPAIFNWDGSVKEPATPTKERTNKGGLFQGIRGDSTYFPLAPAYSKLVPITGYYKVPSNHADRPDLIAKHLYDSVDLWWVIFWSNEIVDPFCRPRAGEVIKIIDINVLLKLLNR